MGTHFSRNGYYILFKWVPILPLNGYPFLNYLVLYRTKYSGHIKKAHFQKPQTTEYHNFYSFT